MKRVQFMRIIKGCIFVLLLSSFLPASILWEQSRMDPRELVLKARDEYLKKNYIAAKQYYQQACDRGDYLGCTGVGTLFERGLGVLQDLGEAYKYYTFACEHKDNFGCFSKQLLERGENSVSLYTKGCEADNSDFCLALGNRYYRGSGVKKDRKLALLYYQKACALKSPEGCFNLGVDYQNKERKTRSDDDYALAYFSLARQYWYGKCQKGERASCSMLGALVSFDVLR